MSANKQTRLKKGKSAVGEHFEEKRARFRKDSDFGFSIVGARPIAVSKVRLDGPAARAGIVVGDFLLKVNGNFVTEADHDAVVKEIQSCTQLDLVVLRRKKPIEKHDTAQHSSLRATQSALPLTQLEQSPAATSAPAEPELPASEPPSSLPLLDRRPSDASDAPAADSELECEPNTEQKRPSVSLDPMVFAADADVDADADADDPDGLTSDERDTVSLCDLIVPMQLSDEKAEAAASCSRLTSIRPRALSVHKPASTSSTSESSPSRRTLFDRHARSSQPSLTIVDADNKTDAIASDGDSRHSLALPAAEDTLNKAPLSSGDIKRLLAYCNDEIGSDEAFEKASPCASAEDLNITASRNATTASAVSPGSLQTQSSVSLVAARSNDCTVFEDFSKCLVHPAQLAVFLTYAWRNATADLNPFLFAVVAENYQVCCTQSPAVKEVRKWAYEIYSAFLTSQSPLTVASHLNTDAHKSAMDTLDVVLSTRFDKEDVMRNAFSDLRRLAADKCSELIRDFTSKVVSTGLGTLYGTQQLYSAMLYDNERALLASTLNTLLEQLGTAKEQNDSRGLLIAALLTLAKHYNLTLPPLVTDKCLPFNAKSKRSQFFKRSSSKNLSIRNHQFTPHQFFVRTLCAVCRSLLIGIGTQGYQCTVCELPVHLECAKLANDSCHKAEKVATEKSSDKRKHSTGPFSLSGSLLRKPSISNQVQSSSANTNTTASARHDNWTPSMFSTMEDTNEFADVDSSRKLSETDSAAPSLNRLPSSNRRAKSEVDRAALEAALRSTINEADEFSTEIRANNSTTDALSSADALRRSISIVSMRDTEREALAKWRDDADLDVEVEMKSLESLVPEALLKKMKPKEKELQKVLNELLYTERTHLRNMKILLNLFYNAWPKERDLEELREMVMPNLGEIVDLHKQFCTELQTARERESNVIVVEEASGVLARWFIDESLQRWKNVCSTFCQFHSQGIELLRIKRKKDLRFDEFLSSLEAESLCRRLQIKDFVPMQMQRLTKYPLLLDGCIKQWNALVTQKGPTNSAVLEEFKAAVTGMRSVLQTVNDRVRECENQFRWTEIQKRIDRSKFEAMTNDSHYSVYKGFSFSSHRMVYDGPLQWRLNKERRLDCHLVLLDTHLLLLRKEDDRLILKSHSVQIADGKDEKKHVTPIMSLASDLFHVREDAREKRGFLLLAATYMYELCTISAEERRKWIDLIVRQMQLNKTVSKSTSKTPESQPTPSTVLPTSVSNVSLPIAPVTASGDEANFNNSSFTGQSVAQFENDHVQKLDEASEAQPLSNPNENQLDLSTNPDADTSADVALTITAISPPGVTQRREIHKRSSSLGDRSAIARLVALSKIEDGDEYEQELTHYLERGRREPDAAQSSTVRASVRLSRHESDSCKYDKQQNARDLSRTLSVCTRPFRSRRRSVGERHASQSPPAFRPSRLGSSRAAAGTFDLLSDEAFAALLRRTSNSIRRRQKQVQVVEQTESAVVDSCARTDLDRILIEIDSHDTAIRNALYQKQRLVDEYLRMQMQSHLLDVSESQSNAQRSSADVAQADASDCTASEATECEELSAQVNTRNMFEQAVGQAQKVLSFMASNDVLTASFTTETSHVSADDLYAALPSDTVLSVLGGLNKHLTDLLRLLANSQPPVPSTPICNDQLCAKVRRAASASPVRSQPSRPFQPSTVLHNCVSPMNSNEAQDESRDNETNEAVDTNENNQLDQSNQSQCNDSNAACLPCEAATPSNGVTDSQIAHDPVPPLSPSLQLLTTSLLDADNAEAVTLLDAVEAQLQQTAAGSSLESSTTDC